MRTSEAIAADVIARRDKYFERQKKRREGVLRVGASMIAVLAVAAAFYGFAPPRRGELGTDTAAADAKGANAAAGEGSGTVPEMEIVRSFGGAPAACYAAPENGKALLSIPLRDAMDAYGDSVLYAVSVEKLRDGEHVAWQEELLTLAEIRRYAEDAGPEYGYALFLAEEG